LKVVIIGAGEVGFNVASRLVNENKDVVVIDKNHEAIRRVSDNIDAQVVTGSGSSPIALAEAGIKDAEIVLAVTNSDETNLVACLVADMLSPSTKKLARIRNADFDQYHDNFRKYAPHIDTLINPEIEVVKTIDIDKDARLAETRLSELSSISEEQRPLIVAVIRKEKLIIPGGDDALLAGDLIYFICEEEKLLDTLTVFDKHAESVQSILIIGGGRIGIRLAGLLDEKSVYTKIIEKNPDRCAKLAERLNKVVVLHGDGTDQELLKEENIQDIDVVVTLTGDEEINILASLLAKQMGARKTITKISKFSYFPLMSAIGIEQVVSPRLSAINTILQHIRRGKVLSSISIKGEQAEFMEAVALETSDIVGKPLKNISFPKGALVAGIIHEEHFIIPAGDSIINPGDMIIIFARKQAIPKVEKILAVKLEYF
jgi:trk system potassium uptake protein TrkA